MKHPFGDIRAYDIERIPVNVEARKMMARQGKLDLTDPNSVDALALCEQLKGSGCFARGVSAMDAASLICSLLKKREVVVTTLSTEAAELKKRELDLKQQELAIRACEANERKQNAKLRTERHKASMEVEKTLDGLFKSIAKELLPEDQYSIIFDLAMSTLQKGGRCDV